MKGELSQFRDLEAFASFGSDLDEDTQRTLARGNRLVATLNQGERQPIPAAEQVAIIYAATNGYIDRVAVERVPDFNQQLVGRLRAEAADLLEKIGGGDWSDETQSRARGDRRASSPTTSATTSTRRASRSTRTSTSTTAAQRAVRRRGRASDAEASEERGGAGGRRRVAHGRRRSSRAASRRSRTSRRSRGRWR